MTLFATKGKYKSGEQVYPEFVSEKDLEGMLDFLDELRESGEINMFESPEHLQYEYVDLGKNGARRIVMYWMITFEERQKSKTKKVAR